MLTVHRLAGVGTWSTPQSSSKVTGQGTVTLEEAAGQGPGSESLSDIAHI